MLYHSTMPCFQEREDRTDHATALEHIVPGNQICWVRYKCEFLFFCLLFDREPKDKKKTLTSYVFVSMVFQKKIFIVQASIVFFMYYLGSKYTPVLNEMIINLLNLLKEEHIKVKYFRDMLVIHAWQRHKKLSINHGKNNCAPPFVSKALWSLG